MHRLPFRLRVLAAAVLAFSVMASFASPATSEELRIG